MFTSMDFMDAYFHIPGARLLHFAFKFVVLPFGLPQSPCVFTRCLGAALSQIKSLGKKVFPYLNDGLFCALILDCIREDTHLLLSHGTELGLTVNYKKSSLLSSQEVTLISIHLHICKTGSPLQVKSIL